MPHRCIETSQYQSEHRNRKGNARCVRSHPVREGDRRNDHRNPRTGREPSGLPTRNGCSRSRMMPGSATGFRWRSDTPHRSRRRTYDETPGKVEHARHRHCLLRPLRLFRPCRERGLGSSRELPAHREVADVHYGITRGLRRHCRWRASLFEGGHRSARRAWRGARALHGEVRAGSAQVRAELSLLDHRHVDLLELEDIR